MSRLAGWLALWLFRFVIMGLVAIFGAVGFLICFPALFRGDQDDGKTGYQ